MPKSTVAIQTRVEQELYERYQAAAERFGQKSMASFAEFAMTKLADQAEAEGNITAEMVKESA